jgi:acetyl esterase/lipase
MKQRGNGLLIFIVAVALLAVAALLIHSPATAPLMAHLHAAVDGASSDEADAPGTEETNRMREGVAAIGRRWDAEAFAETVALYTPVHRELEWPGLLEPETIVYGPDRRQELVLFRPEQEFSEPGPVFVFVHGNGLGADDWRIPGSEGLLLTHAGRLAATFGGFGVLMNYRSGNAGAEDLRLVVEWLKANIARYSGDPDTIVVIAHSEGAALTASYLFDRNRQPDAGTGLAAVILSSASTEEPHRLESLIDDYDGETVPLALWVAEYDTPNVEANMAGLYAQLCRKLQECPWHERFDGHNHMSQLFSFGTDDATVLNAFIRFYHTVR